MVEGDEPLDPQPSMTQCKDCGNIWIGLTPHQTQLVKWCTQLGVQHLRLIAEETISE